MQLMQVLHLLSLEVVHGATAEAEGHFMQGFLASRPAVAFSCTVQLF